MSKRRKVEFKVDENGCHVCTSHKPDRCGYFRIKENYKTKMLHRVVYEEKNGEISDGLIVRHKCDNPSCINPEHLELGTNQDNVDDRDSRGRTAKGSNHGLSKLSESDVKNIRIKLENGSSQASLAKEYNVHKAVIFDIKHRNTWKHI